MEQFPLTSRSPYPTTRVARTRWIRAQRPDWDTARAALPLDRPGQWLVEEEPDSQGRLARVLAVFLTNRECPWHCLMCDLWQHTTLDPVPPGAIPRQIDFALERWRTASLSEPTVSGSTRAPQPHLKLYNAGSFFDRGAIPPEDYTGIADRTAGFGVVTVECHPALIGEAVLRFRDRLGPGQQFEVAMGLETAHPEVLQRLNKGLTVERFAAASQRLRREGIAVRAFVLVQPPFLPEAEAADWAVQSARVAFEAGVGLVALIPTRLGNGALEALQQSGQFRPPSFKTFEAAVERLLALQRGRVIADLWNLEQLCTELTDPERQRARLHQINLTQRWIPQEAARP